MTRLHGKPVRRVVKCAVPFGVRDEIVVSLYPGGGIGLREKGRRRELRLDVGTLYARCLKASAERSPA